MLQPMTRAYLLLLVTLLLASTAAAQDASSAAPAPEQAPAEATAPAPASPSPAPAPAGPAIVVVLDLEPIDVDVNKVKILNGVVTDQLATYEQLEIIAQADIKQMVEFEAEKQALGCDTTSCLAEIAGALGAGYVVFGRVGSLGDVIFVQLNLFDSGKGRAVARETVEAPTLSKLPAKLRVAAAQLVEPLTGIAPPPMPAEAPVVTEAPAATGDTPVLMYAGLGVAGLGVVVAGVGAGAAFFFDDQAGKSELDGADKTTAITFGQASVVTAVVGGAIALAGAGIAGASFVME
jgi:TolB-like protein